MRSERNEAGQASARNYPSPRAGSSAARGRPAGRDRAAAGPRITPPRAPDAHAAERHPRADRSAAPAAARAERAAARSTPRPQPVSGRATRGAVAVLGMFALTLAAGALDSALGAGLGIITTVALIIATIAAGLLVRRRDLLSVVVAPPLVYIGVAAVNIALAPSATFSLPTLATLLIRGFPAMALGVAAAIVVALGRLAARR